MPERKVAVILPALDEQETIGRVIDGIPVELLRDQGYEVDITVIDGHSADRTREIAKARGARLLVQNGRGKGDAIQTAFQQFEGEMLFILDADNTYCPRDIIDMLPLLQWDISDVVMGSRLTGSIDPGAMNGMNYLGNVVLTRVANLLYPTERGISDLCTGMWGFNSEAVQQLNLTATDFQVEAEIFAKCVKHGFRIAEVPVRYMRRTTPPKLRALRDGAKIMWRLVRERM
ncbi:MAG: glycosyltransferase family 2 protein [Candidatus Thermoplasmatota archaeon]